MLRQWSFKPAKFKTALKLAVSRIKLLKNKKEAYLKQLRRELAQLLRSGHDHTATTRVELLVSEEKTMAAYDLIEIYCELIAARLPVIESHKKCPIDLKEAISSVIFASPRCSDVPELMDVQKQIIAKYGKEFVSSTVALHPDCGVNCLLVEKLSAKAPDGSTKIKILSAIAEEHGVKWQPKQFGEIDVQSSQDLLAGQNAFERASYVEAPQVHVAPFEDEKGPPNLHAFYQLKEIHDIPTNSYEHSASFATRKACGDRSKTSGESNPEIRSLGIGSQKMDIRDSFGENSSSAFPLGRQNWNMEFKDAASAAKAAAESAEHASMAARAAVQLSNREKLTRRYSSGSHSCSSGSESRGEVPQGYAFHDCRTSSFRKHNEQINVREQDYKSASQTYSSAFGNDIPFAYGSQTADVIYPHNNSFKQGNSDVDFGTEMHADMMTKNNDRIGDARSRTKRQFGKASSSHSVISSDDHNDYTFVVDKEYKESGLFFPSPPGRKSVVEPLSNSNAWKESSSSSWSHFFTVPEILNKSAVSSRKEDSFPDIFYDSDAPSSDNDEDFVKSVSGNFVFGNSVLDQSENHVASGTSSSRSDEKVASDRKSWFPPSSVGSDIVEEDFKRKISIKTVSEKNFGHASFSGRSSTVSDYNRPPYTKSKSVELEHKRVSSYEIKNHNRSDKTWASSEHGTEQNAANRPSSSEPNRSTRVKPSSSVPKTMIPDRDEVASKSSSNFDGGVPSQERPRLRPSHVHPKLPEYESITAYFLSLKKGPQ